MSYLFILAIVGGLAWINTRMVTVARGRRAGAGWWAVMFAAWAAGGAVGAWCGFAFEYQAGARLRVAGAPVPAAFFHLEGPPGEERWIDFITPVPIFNAAINIPILALSAGCLVGLMLRVWRALGSRVHE